MISSIALAARRLVADVASSGSCSATTDSSVKRGGRSSSRNRHTSIDSMVAGIKIRKGKKTPTLSRVEPIAGPSNPLMWAANSSHEKMAVLRLLCCHYQSPAKEASELTCPFLACKRQQRYR